MQHSATITDTSRVGYKADIAVLPPPLLILFSSGVEGATVELVGGVCCLNFVSECNFLSQDFSRSH